MNRFAFRLTALAFVLLSVLSLPSTSSADCPRKRFSGICAQVITYAINPQTGECCVYPNPCVVPDGWVKSYSGCPSAS
jgi:hypothetical protein